VTKQVPKPVAERYGKLTVLRFESPMGWRVRCDCGTEKHYNGNNLRSGTYVSCGCARYDKHRVMMRQRHEMAKAAQGIAQKPSSRMPTSGTRCWCCRAFTGKTEPVALCRVCEGKKS